MRVINSTKILKKIIFPTSCASVAAAAVAQKSPDEGEKKKERELIRPRDLPIYSSEPVKKKCEPKASEMEQAIQSTIQQVREGTGAVVGQVKSVTNQICDVYNTGKAHTSTTLSYLREEDNSLQRYGAIGLGGLAGLLLSVRRGFFKKIFYTTTGAVGMAALLYPEEAREYSSEGMKIVKKYVVVGYHFVNGVLRDYAGLQLPALPEPLSANASVEKDVSSQGMMPPSHVKPGAIPLPPLEAPHKGK